MKTIRCKNPQCLREFTLDADHRFGGCCCAICQRAITPHNSSREAPHIGLSVLAPRPSIQRKPGTDRKVKTE